MVIATVSQQTVAAEYFSSIHRLVPQKQKALEQILDYIIYGTYLRITFSIHNVYDRHRINSNMKNADKTIESSAPKHFIEEARTKSHTERWRMLLESRVSKSHNMETVVNVFGQCGDKWFRFYIQFLCCIDEDSEIFMWNHITFNGNTFNWILLWMIFHTWQSRDTSIRNHITRK